MAGPLLDLRPRLGQLFAWASAGPRFARSRLPTTLLLLMELTAGQLKRAHTAGCRESSKELGELFRLYAKAEGDDVAVGGWLSRDGVAVGDATWFAVRLDRATTPWAFAWGEMFRVSPVSSCSGRSWE